MHTSLLLPERYRGRVTVRSGDIEVESHNAVVYQGGDILAALAAGKPEYRIAAMYFEYENTAGAVTAAAVTRADTAASRQGVAAPYDLVRAPLIATPLLTAADVNHQANRAAYHALTTAVVGMNGLAFTAAANSKIYAVCLVATPGGSNALQDLVYARALLSSPVPMGGSGQVSCGWIAEFN